MQRGRQAAVHDICVCVSRVGSGHYTAYGSHEGRWYHFNDSTVTLTSEETVRKAKAYILFYVERTGQVASEKTDSKPDAETVDKDSGPSEAVAQDKVAADMVLMDAAVSHMKTEDLAAPDNAAALENVGEEMAEMASIEPATHNTSHKAASEEASQAIQAVAQ